MQTLMCFRGQQKKGKQLKPNTHESPVYSPSYCADTEAVHSPGVRDELMQNYIFSR